MRIYFNIYIYIYIHTSKIQKTCANGIRTFTMGRYDDGGDGTATMCRLPDDDSSAARRRCADGCRRHDDDMMLMRRQRDDRHKPGLDMS